MKKYQNRPIPPKIDPLYSTPRVEPVKDPPAMPGLGIPADSLTGRPAVEIRVVKPTCGLCRYWVRYDETKGICKAHAPRPFPARSLADLPPIPLWPPTHQAEWCGEFEAGEQRK